MTFKEAYEKLRRERLALEHENKKLKEQIASFDKQSYVSDAEAKHLKEISKLTWENKKLINQRDRYKEHLDIQISVAENYRVAAFDAECERDSIKKELDYYIEKTNELENRIQVILGESSSHDKDLESQIFALKEALLKEKAKADRDGTNSGTPTSQTPYNKKKLIPNSRVKSNRKRGAQPGHAKHSLSSLSADDITDTINHELNECSNCHSSNLIFLEKKNKDVIDYEVILKKIRHSFYTYECSDCGKIVHSSIPLNLKEDVQYGPNIQALGLALQNIGFVSVNRTRKLVNGIISNNLSISEGYICKLQRKASKALSTFIDDVRIECIKSPILHWDDTVIFINTKQGCMRFYGNNKLALYKAHEKKNREGIDEDGILGALGPNTTVIHDHITMNYNDDFHFRNAECVQHLERDLQKVIDISQHSWAIKMKEIISEALHERNELVAVGSVGFTNQRLYSFLHSIDSLLELAYSEHEESIGRYYETDERRLITRIDKYKDNHFLWAKDFSIAPTNNLAERSLRGQKVKLKVSGQFQSIDTAGFFADIRTYTETCYRNGISTFEALSRLTAGNPYSLQEVLSNT